MAAGSVCHMSGVRRIVAVLLGAGLVLAPLAATGSPGPGHVRAIVDRYCKPSGEFCTSVERGPGVHLVIATRRYKGPYRLCLKPPRRGFDCGVIKVPMHKHGDGGRVFRSDRTLESQMSHPTHGPYSVKWLAAGSKQGRTLHFRR